MSPKRGAARRFGLWSGVVVLLGVSICLADDVTDLLKKLETRRGQARTLHHVTKTIARTGGVTRETTTETWEKRDGKTVKWRIARTTKTTGGEGKTDKKEPEVQSLTVSDGKTEWRELPMRPGVMAVKGKPVPAPEYEGIRTTLRRGKARIRPQETVRGRMCIVIEAVGREDDKPFKATYWIGERSGLVLKSVVKRADLASTEMVTTQLVLDEPVDDSMFAYSPPSGATVIDTEAIGASGKGAATSVIAQPKEP